MLGLAALFFLIAILCYFFGGREAGSLALMGAKVCLLLFVILLILSLFVGSTYQTYPVVIR